VDESYVSVPEFITVHLGAPNENAANLTIPFPDYLKNIAAASLYPTWPENALRANVWALATFTLSRIFTGWYRSRGYNFDVTSTAEHDRKFIRNHNGYVGIGRIVDTSFREYLVKTGSREPCMDACGVIPPWGTVTLANEGYQPHQIIQYYCGEDVSVENAAVPSYGEEAPDCMPELGSSGREVEFLQYRLNRIGQNYPTIPLISPAGGVFDNHTEQAVRQFQRIFDLTPDGAVGPETWYRICRVYDSIKRLSDLYSEGILLSDIPKQCPKTIYLGQKGRKILLLRFYVNVIAAFYQEIGPVEAAGGYDKSIRDQVIGLQKLAGLMPNGIVDGRTWDAVYSIFAGIMENVPQKYLRETDAGKPAGRYPGYDLKETGEAADE